MKSHSLADLAKHLNAELHGDGEILITELASMSHAQTGQISFLADVKHQPHLITCNASAMILTKESLPFWSGSALVVANPYLVYAQLAHLLDSTPAPAEGIAPSAVIAADVRMGKQVSIGANTVIESGVVLEDNVSIGAGCFIGKNTSIGKGTRIWANVTIYHNVTVGQEGLIQSGAVIGADGFGYANDCGKWIKIPQLGSVRIGNRVEIGACTTIDRGALDDTIIGHGVIIDNQCQIAHNDIIGDHTAVAGGVIMAGSLKIGRHCMIGGASVINGHMEIGDKVTITGMGMVMRPISKPGIYSSGIPLQPNNMWRKTASLVLHIDKIDKRLKALEKKLKQIKE